MECVSIEKCFSMSKKGFICNDCHAPVALVLDTVVPAVVSNAAQTPRFFRHIVEDASCNYSIRKSAKTSPAVSLAPLVSKPSNTLWLQSWTHLNPNSSTEWIFRDTRSNSVKIGDDTTQIFDATCVPIYEYSGYLYNKKPLFFCIDEYSEKTPIGSTLWHTSDGQLLESDCYDRRVTVLCDEIELNVRFLTGLHQKNIAELDSFFGKLCWPPSHGSKQSPVQVQHPLQVLSFDGRMFMDKVHREAFNVMPTKPLTIYNAPPGIHMHFQK